MKFIKYIAVHFIASGVAIYVSDHYLNVLDITHTDTISYIKVLSVAIVILGIVNIFVRPIIKIISLPFVLITMGLFAIVINAILFYFVTIVVPEIVVFDIKGYFVVPIMLGVFHWISHIVDPVKKK